MQRRRGRPRRRRAGVPAAASLITIDDDEGGRLGADHLLELGHTRIGHLSGSGGAAAHRREGFRSRIAEAGVEVRIAGEAQGTSKEDGYAAACWILDHRPDTTALFAANDTMARVPSPPPGHPGSPSRGTSL
ncbi:substrate-binding domain-containing protein [Arthrobacter sp. AL12]|nr:substrate-binding domain-containing protein [Arthrobacter sp. AL12]MDI3210534.1 substrate-binding domain-containing protein [Arthrobacter sp. AL12]